MNAKEKAIELVSKYESWVKINECQIELTERRSKQCALICVDELIESLEINTWENRKIIEYYQEVKQEIEKL